jgi:hypothetical protein
MVLWAELGPLSHDEIVRRVINHCPEVLLVGHSGSTSAHPIVAKLTRAVYEVLPNLTIVYGGVFPTYHFRDILAEEPQIYAIDYEADYEAVGGVKHTSLNSLRSRAIPTLFEKVVVWLIFSLLTLLLSALVFLALGEILLDLTDYPRCQHNLCNPCCLKSDMQKYNRSQAYSLEQPC